MSSPSPTSSNELSTKANKGSTDSSPVAMPSSEDSTSGSTSGTSLAAERLNRFIEDECTTPTDLLSVETPDVAKPSPSTERIESEINAFDDAFGDDRNGTVEHKDDEKEDEEGNQDRKDEEGKEGEGEEGEEGNEGEGDKAKEDESK